MPLIIHPESSCDVCLENLTYDESRPPHAIPCGHIFCGSCLFLTYPRHCPLCREPYSFDFTRKLIIGERPTVNEMPMTIETAETELRHTATEPDKDDDLLRRLAVLWNSQGEEPLALLAEIDTWLQSRSGDMSLPLREAREAFTSYRELTAQRDNNETTITQLRTSLQLNERLASSDRFAAVAVEQSLLEQLEEMHMKLAQTQSENEMLREENSTLKSVRRPSLSSPRLLSPEGGFPPFVQPTRSESKTPDQRTPVESSSPINLGSRSLYVNISPISSSHTSDFEVQTPTSAIIWWDTQRSAIVVPPSLPRIEVDNLGVSTRNMSAIVASP